MSGVTQFAHPYVSKVQHRTCLKRDFLPQRTVFPMPGDGVSTIATLFPPFSLLSAHKF